MRIILLGPPGAGKGTQAQFIIDQYQVAHIATGDMLRAAVAEGTALGLKAKVIMAAGELVPDEIIIELVKERIQADDCRKGFLFDGFPRTLQQGKALVDSKIEIDLVIEIKVDFVELVNRLAGRRVHQASGRVYHLKYNPPKVAGKDDVTGEDLIQRPDDQEDTIRKRLQVYTEQTKPLIAFYQDIAANKGNELRFTRVEGLNSVENVKTKIFSAIDA